MFINLKNRHNMRRTFYTYFLSFLIVSTIIIFTIAISSYQTTSKALADEIVKHQSSNLNHKKNNLDTFIKDTLQTAYLIGLNSGVNIYTKDAQNHFLANDISSMIENLDTSSNSIVSIEVYFNNSGKILSSDGAGRIINEELTSTWLDAMSRTDQNHLWTLPNAYYDLDYKSIPVISYIQKLPIGSGETLGYVAIHIKESYINSLINYIDNSMNTSNDSADVMLVDTKGSILSSSDKPLLNQAYGYHSYNLINDSTYVDGYIMTNSKYNHRIINFVKLESAPWVLVSETPYSVISDRTRNILETTLVLSIIVLIFSIIISYLLTIRLYSPIKGLMLKADNYDDMKKKDEENAIDSVKNELSYVSHFIDSIQTNIKHLEKEIFINKPLVIDRFMRDLLSNKLQSFNNIQQQLDRLDLDFPSYNHMVMVIEINDYEQLLTSESILSVDTTIFAVKNIVHEIININDKGICSEYQQGQIIAMINLDDYVNFDHYLFTLASKIKTTLFDLLDIDVTIAIGSKYESLSDLHLSFREALNIIDYKIVFDNNILLYDSYNRENVTDYYYPIKLILSITEATKSTDFKRICSCLEQIFSNLEEKYNLTYENCYKILNQLIDALLLALSELGYSPADVWNQEYKLYSELNKHTSISSTKEWFLSIYQDACTYIKTNTSKESFHIEHIKNYIQCHFSKDIYLDLIASEVGLNPSYMSRIFKQETGQTIVEYMTKLRIQESKNLLKATRLPIKEIAEKVGYNNIHSFMRYFKASESITPGNYRKIHL